VRGFSPAGSQPYYASLNSRQLELNHPSLHAKKYKEAKDIWQARINRNWRLYFAIEDDAILIVDVTPHPK